MFDVLEAVWLAGPTKMHIEVGPDPISGQMTRAPLFAPLEVEEFNNTAVVIQHKFFKRQREVHAAQSRKKQKVRCLAATTSKQQQRNHGQQVAVKHAVVCQPAPSASSDSDGSLLKTLLESDSEEADSQAQPAAAAAAKTPMLGRQGSSAIQAGKSSIAATGAPAAAPLEAEDCIGQRAPIIHHQHSDQLPVLLPPSCLAPDHLQEVQLLLSALAAALGACDGPGLVSALNRLRTLPQMRLMDSQEFSSEYCQLCNTYEALEVYIGGAITDATRRQRWCKSCYVLVTQHQGTTDSITSTPHAEAARLLCSVLPDGRPYASAYRILSDEVLDALIQLTQVYGIGHVPSLEELLLKVQPDIVAEPAAAITPHGRCYITYGELFGTAATASTAKVAAASASRSGASVPQPTAAVLVKPVPLAAIDTKLTCKHTRAKGWGGEGPAAERQASASCDAAKKKASEAQPKGSHSQHKQQQQNASSQCSPKHQRPRRSSVVAAVTTSQSAAAVTVQLADCQSAAPADVGPGYISTVDTSNLAHFIHKRDPSYKSNRDACSAARVPVIVKQLHSNLYPLLNPMTDTMLEAEHEVNQAVAAAATSGAPTAASMTAAAAAQVAVAAAEARGVHWLDRWMLEHRFCAAAGVQLTYKLYNQVLLLLGTAGTGTPGHVDPARALTYAYPLLMPGETWDDSMKQVVLATWLFVASLPEVLINLRDWMIDNKKLTKQQQKLLKEHQSAVDRQGGSTAAKTKKAVKRKAKQQRAAAKVELEVMQGILQGCTIDVNDIDAIVEHLGPRWAKRVDQHAGQGVAVEVGWMHWVSNQRANLKVAYELLRPADALAATVVQQHIRCKLANQPDDYMRITDVVVQALLQHHTYCTNSES